MWEIQNLKRRMVILIIFLLISTINVSVVYSASIESKTQTDIVIEGPTQLSEGEISEYTIYLNEPGNCDISKINIDWGDNWTTNWIGPFESSHIFNLNHDWWEGAGVYTIKVTIYECSVYYKELNVTIENLPPNKPTINGRTIGTPRTYKYTFFSSDPGNNDVSYYIKWGDGNITDWTEFQWSEFEYSEDHTWSQGTFKIEAKTKDIHGAESDWAELQVNMPKSYRSPLTLRFFNFLKNFFQLKSINLM